MAAEIKVPGRFTHEKVAAVWRVFNSQGTPYFTLAVGDRTLLSFPTTRDLNVVLAQNSKLDFVYECGTQIGYYRADSVDGIVTQVLAWMDGHFGHDLSNIVVNATVITRGVDAIFQLPQFRRIKPLQNGITMLLTMGFARHYRHAKWIEIVRNQAYSHVVGEFTRASLDHLPEIRSVISTSMSHIENELRAGRG